MKRIPPKPPIEWPPNELIKEGEFSRRDKCIYCGSSLHRKFFIFVDGCIQPKCKNYWNKKV